MQTRIEALELVKELVPQVIERLPDYSDEELRDLYARCLSKIIYLAFDPDSLTEEGLMHLHELREAIEQELAGRAE